MSDVETTKTKAVADATRAAAAAAPTKKSADKAVRKPANRPANKPASNAVDKAADKPLRITDTNLPIRMLHDRVLVDPDADLGERRSSGGILIPATVQMGRRMSWAKVVATGSNVRVIKVNDRVLFDPHEKLEVELHSKMYLLMRERDVHAVAAERVSDDSTGLYL